MFAAFFLLFLFLILVSSLMHRSCYHNCIDCELGLWILRKFYASFFFWWGFPVKLFDLCMNLD
uniref:Uncharacterized protein n=1 Tax=Rhizophora mucronata TaxID=61149 RepID=A0A2P2NTE0_RHIMU